MPPEEVPPALVVLTAPEDAPFLCLAPPALPPALGDDVPLGLPAPTLVALAAGPGILLLLLFYLLLLNLKLGLRLSYNKSLLPSVVMC